MKLLHDSAQGLAVSLLSRADIVILFADGGGRSPFDAERSGVMRTTGVETGADSLLSAWQRSAVS